MSTQLFGGERALVTGSASNIGRAIALGLAREGARVLLADVDAARNAAVAADIARAGGTAETVTCDLSTRDGWKAVLEQATAEPLAMLVHSASPPRREVDHALAVGEEVWDAMVNTNLRSGFFLARGIGLHMKAAGIAGRILFITSLHAETPRNLPHYSASKAGQTMVVRELARALGPAGIRVNAVAPGAIPGGGFNAKAISFDGKIPLGRLGSAEDVAAASLTLLSNQHSAYVSGATLAVDGGIAGYNWIPSVAT